MNPLKHAALLGAVVCLASAVHADDAALRTEIDTDHVKLVAAEKKGDVLAFEKLSDTLFAPTFTIKPVHGDTRDYTEYLAGEKARMASLKGMDDQFTIKSVAVKGDTAIETGTRVLTGAKVDAGGVMGPKGKTHQLSDTSAYRMHWIKVADTWKMASVDVLSATFLVDGAPYHPLPPPAKPAAPRQPSPPRRRTR